MPDGKRLWRTEKGDLVEDGHKEALLLAYGVADDLSSEDAKLVRGGGKSAKVEEPHRAKAERDATPKLEAAPAKAAPERPAKKAAAMPPVGE